MKFIFLAFIITCIIFISYTKDQWQPYYHGSKSDHFDGSHFYDKSYEKKSFADFLKWQWTRNKQTWPKWIETQATKPDTTIEPRKTKVTFINHASVLIQTQGLNLLTDPIWSERSSPVSWIGPKRVRNPGIKFKDLPPIDYVLLSHNHYDHLDIPTLQRLIDHSNPTILTGLGICYYLNTIKQLDLSCREMDWQDTIMVNDKLRIIFLPAKHWSKRGLFDTNRTLWGAFAILTPQHKIYFAGDTGYAKHFQAAQQQFGAFDISLLPIGSYEPREFMKPSHMNPSEAVQAHLDLQSKQSIAIHLHTFQLTDEAYDAPDKALNATLQQRDIDPDQFQILELGQSLEID